MNSNQGAGQRTSQKMSSTHQVGGSERSLNSSESREQMRGREVDQTQRAGARSNSSEGSQLVEMFGQSLPQESRENIERMMTDATNYIREARAYVKENPGEAAGLAMTAGAVLWALFGTKPGRRVFEAGSAAAMPVVSNWIAKNFSQPIH